MSSETPEMAATSQTLEAPSTGPSKHSMYGWLVCFLGAVFYLYEYLLRVAPSQMTTELMDAFSINATALGLEKDDPSPVSLLDFPSSTKIYDMIYNPPETSLLKQAKLMGMACENGLSMLVHQAVRSLSIWTEQEISVQAMFNGARSAIPI